MPRSNRRRPERPNGRPQGAVPRKPRKPKRNPRATGVQHAHIADHGTCPVQSKRCFTAGEAEAILRNTRRARSLDRTERSSYHCNDCGWTHLSSNRSNPTERKSR